MGLAARRRLAFVLPWVALAAVTVFALVQMRARHRAEACVGEAAAGPPPVERPAEPAVAEVAAAEVAGVQARAKETLVAARAAGDALDAALEDLAEARADLGRETALRRAVEARWEEAAAARAVLEARRAADEQVARGLGEEVEVLRAKVLVLEEPPRGWIADASSEDEARHAAARAAAGGATAEDVALMGVLLEEDPRSATAIAGLLSAVPASLGSDDLASRVLTAPGADAARARAVGKAVLKRPAVALAVLTDGEAGVVEESVRLLSGRLPNFDEDAREELRARLSQRLDGHGSWPPALTLRVVAALKLEGLVDEVVPHLAGEDVAARAGAAHALSRLPDLAEVRAEAIAALPDLLLAEDVPSRLGGFLLAAALTGDPTLAMDPGAGEAERREAVERILDRLR